MIKILEIDREGYPRWIKFEPQTLNSVMISSNTDDIVFDKQEAKRLRDFLNEVLKEDSND